MPTRESTPFKFGYINLETGEASELGVITEPIDLPDEDTGDFPNFSKPTTFTFEARQNKKFLHDVYAMLYQGFSNSAKMHGGRTFRWRTYLRTIR